MHAVSGRTWKSGSPERAARFCRQTAGSPGVASTSWARFGACGAIGSGHSRRFPPRATPTSIPSPDTHCCYSAAATPRVRARRSHKHCRSPTIWVECASCAPRSRSRSRRTGLIRPNNGAPSSPRRPNATHRPGSARGHVTREASWHRHTANRMLRPRSCVRRSPPTGGTACRTIWRTRRHGSRACTSRPGIMRLRVAHARMHPPSSPG